MTYCLANASRGVSSAAWDSEASFEKVSNLCLFFGLAQLQQKCKNVSSARTFNSSDFKHGRTIAKQKVCAVFISLTEYKLDVEFPFGRKDWTGDALDSPLYIASYIKDDIMNGNSEEPKQH